MSDLRGSELLDDAELEFSQAPVMVKVTGGAIFRKVLVVLRWLVDDAMRRGEELRKLRALVERGMDFDEGGEDGAGAGN